jgi:hypothetical protein
LCKIRLLIHMGHLPVPRSMNGSKVFHTHQTLTGNRPLWKPNFSIFSLTGLSYVYSLKLCGHFSAKIVFDQRCFSCWWIRKVE